MIIIKSNVHFLDIAIYINEVHKILSVVKTFNIH